MSIERKLIGTVDAAATQAVYIEDVMATHLYTGTGASQTINNGIDLATKGGMVWLKGRSGATANALYDTSRGATSDLVSSSTAAATTQSTGLNSFGTTGFTIGALAKLNTSAATYASWTFRKQPKFFDIVTYTGNDAAERTIPHNLGCVPGMIIIKAFSGSSAGVASAFWNVYHKSLSTGSYLYLQTTAAVGSDISRFRASPTSTEFFIGSDSSINNPSDTYVAYLFADSNSGGFGAAGTDSVVACGSYTTNSAASATVNLGWEPQFLLMKRTDSTGNWRILDVMRGDPNAATGQRLLHPNLSAAEQGPTNGYGYPTATGFQVDSDDAINAQFIYLAIRRGPMKTPTDATKVFAPAIYTGNGSTGQTITTGFPVDFSLYINRTKTNSTNNVVFDRLRGQTQHLATNTTDAEAALSTTLCPLFDSNTGIRLQGSTITNASGAPFIVENFRRAPGYMDVVCYTGTGSATTVAHNLGVAPELMIVKARSGTDGGGNLASSCSWAVYHAAVGNTKALFLNMTNIPSTSSHYWNNTSPASSVFSLGGALITNSTPTITYVAYLFATCHGVSKVFYFTGNGSSQTIDCGFTSGARFVLIKRTDAAGDWYVWDTARGIVAGNDPHLSLNTTAAEVTDNDTIDTAGSGFIVNQVAATNVNVSSATYIGLAIA